VAVKAGRTPRSRRTIYVCEVSTHIRGMGASAIRKVPEKLARVRDFAEATFPGGDYRSQWWSPYVHEGATTRGFNALVDAWAAEKRKLEFVINEEYRRRVGLLAEQARKHPATASEPAYRMLQILTHLRGDALVL
jgi:hypothetical protein